MPVQDVHLMNKLKPKRCAHCDRTFTKEEHLRRHERSHTGEKPFRCHKCNKRYARSDVLARHLQTHPHDSTPRWHRTSAAERPPMTYDLTEPQNRVSKINQNARNGLFTAENHGYVLQDHEQQVAMPHGDRRPSAGLQKDFGQPHSLHGAEDYMSMIMPQVTRRGQAQIYPEPGNAGMLRSPISDPWRGATHENMNEASPHDWRLLAPIPGTANQSISTSDHAAHDESTHAVHELHSIQSAVHQPSLWQMMHDEDILISQPAHDDPMEAGAVQDSRRSTLQSSSMQSSNGFVSPPRPTGAHRGEADTFMLEADFSACTYLSPGISNFLDFATPRTPTSSTPDLHDEKDASPEILFSVDQVQRMRPLWRSRRTVSGVRMARSMWHSVVQHTADNIVSRPDSSYWGHPEHSSEGPQTSRWGVDNECRERLSAFCKTLDRASRCEEATDPLTQSTPGASDPDVSSAGSLTLSSVDGLPTREVFDASLDLFFQCSHVPCIHKATFDAKSVPESLLLAIHLVGLSSLYPERSRLFILHYQKKLIRFCCSDLTSKVPSHCRPWETFAAIASALLVVYLALGYLEQVDEGQAHMLCIQMLLAAEKYGLFAASDGDDPTSQLRGVPTDCEESWKAWCRVESITRMASCLVWMDMAYVRIMGGAGVLDIDKVELHLPADFALFEAPTSNRFSQLTQRTPQNRIPPMRIQNFHLDPPPTLNHMSMETLLVALYLQTATIRHGLPSGYRASYHMQSVVSDEEFSADSKTKDVIATLLSLPSRYANLFQHRHRVTAFAWNNVCIAVTADLNLLEIASGRDGLDAARTAMLAVSRWSKTARARRATLHAAQIFDILSSSRLSEWNIARPDLLLFQSGLVLSMYVFVCEHWKNDHDSAAFELLQNIDWTAVGHEGFHRPSQTMPPSPTSDEQSSSGAGDEARDFIRHGGPLCFSGEVLNGGGLTARKILLNYVHLLDDIGKYRGSSYSLILKTMSDFVIEGNH